ncbi:MAG: hypothetical protein JSV94_01275 [Methanobacteriota archaeon]|nr:MAG: hypothetical protein JSV94_01275 [Euryarchaeota archaeon]
MLRLIDLFFTGIFASIILLWVLGVRGFKIGRIASAMKRHLAVTSVLFWTALIIFAALFIVYFDYFADIHDIDEAVQAAVKHYLIGVNPYEEYVVPRFQGKYAPNVMWTLGPYNYLPIDLFVYVGLHEAIGWLGFPTWFVIANLILSGAAFVVLRKILKTDWIAYAPVAGIVMLFFSFDNASLTLLLMVLSMFAYKRAKWHPGGLAILIMALATLTKVFAGIPLVVLVLYEFQAGIKARSWKRVGETVTASAMGAGIALLLFLPFGITNVLDAAVFFHGSEDLRVGTSVGGTILSEILSGSEYYTMISAAVVFAALVVGMRLKSLNDRALLAIVAFLLVAVKSSLAPLTVAGLFLILRLKELSDERIVTRNARDSDTTNHDLDAAQVESNSLTHMGVR